MEKTEEELYIETIYSILDNLKGKIEFSSNNIYYDNIELSVLKSNIDGINTNDFSISFQKQNGSFTLITNKSLFEEKTKQIVNLVSETCGSVPLASYSFCDMNDIMIYHWCYDDKKIEFNKNILEQYKDMKQIENLLYLNVDSPKHII